MINVRYNAANKDEKSIGMISSFLLVFELEISQLCANGSHKSSRRLGYLFRFQVLLVLLRPAIALFIRRCHHLLYCNRRVLGRFSGCPEVRQALAEIVWVAAEKEWD